MPLQQVSLSNIEPFARTLYQDFSGNGSTDWVQFSNTDIMAQVVGTGSAITVVIERSAVDPITPGGPAVLMGPVSPTIGSGVSGNPSTGITTSLYTEIGVGWWRATVSALTGTARVALTGVGS